MNKKIIAIILTLLAFTGGILLLWQNFRKTPDIERFSLSEEYYGEGVFEEIDAARFAELVENNKSFVVVPRMMFCPAGMPMATNAETIAARDNIKIFSILDIEFKQTELAKTVKYLPSAAIYRDGKLVAWLDAESDDDMQFYESPDGFELWLKTYLSF